MDSVISKLPRAKETLAFLAFGITAFCALLLLNGWLWSKGIASEQALFFGEKARLALEAAPPRMVNIAFIVPTAPYVLTLLLRDPLIANSLTGALAITILAALLYVLWRQRKAPLLLCAIGLVFPLFSPLCWYVLSQRPELCWFFLLFFAALSQLYSYYCRGHELHLILYGVLMGVLIYVTGEVLFLSILMLPILVKVAQPRGLPNRAILIIGLFPSLFFILLTSVLTGAYHSVVALGEVQSATLIPFSDQLVSQAARGDLSAAMGLVGSELFRHLLLIAPCLLCPLASDRRESPLYLVLGVLPAYLILRVFFGTYQAETAFYLFFPLFAFLYMTGMPHGGLMERKWLSGALAALLILSLGASATVPLSSANREERAFFQALYGLPYQKNLAERAVKSLDREAGKILVDDQAHYQLVYRFPDLSRFILPYQYDFEMALSSPGQFAEVVVVSRSHPRDRVRQRYPSGLKGFRVAASDEDVIIYRRL